MLLKISTATTVTIGPVLDSDGAAVTSAVVTNFSLSKNGSSAALTTETLTHLGNGYYTLALTATNTNTLGNIEIYVNNVNMSMTVFRYNVIAAQVYDSIVSGSDLLQVDVREMLADVITSSTLATSAVEEIADQVWDEAYADHTLAGSFGKLLNTLRKANLAIEGVVSNAITPTTLTFSSNISATTSAYAHAVLLFVSGPLAGENSPIVSYTNANGVFVLEEPLTAAPSNGDEFVVVAASHVHSVAEIQSGLATSSGLTAAFTEIKGAGWSASTDTLEKIRDASGSITVAPLQAVAPNRVAGTEVVTYINDVSAIGPIVVTDSNGNAVDLSALTLKVCIEKVDGTILANVTPTVSGAGNNQVTFTPNADSVAKTGTYRWSLRETSSKTVYALGDFVVDPAARLS